MKPRYFFSLLAISLMFSCQGEYKFIINSPKKIQSNQELKISLSEKNDREIDSVRFSIGNLKLETIKNSAKININSFRLGKHIITAIVFYKDKSKKVEKPVFIMADSKPDLYTYEIINTYPHDKKAYTQGLEFLDGFLYEGTGKNGSSTIRKVELETGKVLQQKKIDAKYFGEGITILNDKLYQLTWKGGVGFVYDLQSFKKEKEFKYTKSREGWGLANDGKKIIKTDGTERIWFLNPDTLIEENYIEAYTNSQKVEKLNELEYINGKIYANRWQLNSILIINPENGKVEGVANLNSLYDLISKEQQFKSDEDVLNGIAFDKDGNRLFVTGKHWSKLYVIKLIKK